MRKFSVAMILIFIFLSLSACQSKPLDAKAEEARWEKLTPEQQEMMTRSYDLGRQKEAMNQAINQAERAARPLANR